MKRQNFYSLQWILLFPVFLCHPLHVLSSVLAGPLIPFEVDKGSSEYGEITGSMYILEEDGKAYSPDELIENLQEFSRYSGKRLLKEKAYWFVFQIRNSADDHLDFVLDLGGFDFFDFYSIRDGEIDDPVRGGLLRPAWDLTFPEENRSSVPFGLEPQKTGTFLIRVENSEYFNYQPVFKLYAKDNFNNINNRETRNFWQGIFHGVLWVMIIYNFFFALIGRDRTYLYYALYMIAISLYFLNIFGYLTKYVYPDNPGIGTYVWLVMQSAAVFYIIFVRKFLNLKEVHRKWYQISKYLLIAVVIFVLFKAAYFFVFKGYGILSYLSQIVLFLGVVFTGGLIFSLFKTKNQLAKYFTIGSVSLGLGLLGASMIALSGDAYSKYFFYSIQAGIVFEIFFFSIGLSYKMRESEREKRRVQEELIRQLKENEILQLNYQRELEQKVVERTREIEDQKEVLKFQKDRLQELNQEKNHLISIVAHDLRNPLTSALSMAQLLSSDGENDEKSEIGKVLAGSLKRMNEMVEKILDIRAIESREINLDEETFDLGKETGLIIDDFAGQAERKSIRVHKELDQATVFLDRYYFKQVVENLISNALKFSPEGSNIFVSTGQVNGKARISIKDEGPGFTLEDKKRMFGKYQKLSARPTGGESSTGIGLSIVKKYVDAMRGNISCQSESGKGATFMVEFNNK